MRPFISPLPLPAVGVIILFDHCPSKRKEIYFYYLKSYFLTINVIEHLFISSFSILL